jgi:hypothetical protein
MMRDFKRREMIGLADFYAAKLAALEETLLVGAVSLTVSARSISNLDYNYS